MSDKKIVCLNWNVLAHEYTGKNKADGKQETKEEQRRRYSQIAHFLAEQKADVITLQEVNKHDALFLTCTNSLFVHLFSRRHCH
jgi:hypothetical protein